MQNIAKAFIDIAETAHEWAEDMADSSGRCYDAIREAYGQRNRWFREALEEMQWQAGDADREPVDPSFEIEF